jgi:7-keto-8-aminopelargonate synthetase-like enzyme
MPDLAGLIRLTEQYEAILIIDMAHDFGAMGKRGLGVLEQVEKWNYDHVVICGSFSKSFSSNGGFVAGPESIRTQLMVYSPSYTFSNGISPVQCAVAMKCAEIIFSERGNELRERLHQNIAFGIEAFNRSGFETGGIPSPIVPVVIGPEDLARLMSKENVDRGLLANLAEFPAVPRHSAIFRFQMMSTHHREEISNAVSILCDSRDAATRTLKTLK